MNLTDAKYKDSALVQEMLETPEVMRRFNWGQAREAVGAIKQTKKLFLAGEGSSRIFPAKNLRTLAMKQGMDITIGTEGSRQAQECDLSQFVVFGASNSGQTKEVIALFQQLKQQGHRNLFGVTANEGTKLADAADHCYVLSCGKENAVAATKSVVEQALFYQALLGNVAGNISGTNSLAAVADKAKQVLETELDPKIVNRIARASMVYFAGRNDGVAEELALKTNEITRKKSDFLEGTYAVHGIEEVMDSDAVVIVVDPFEEEEHKFKEVLVDGVGLEVVAIASRQTSFPTTLIPSIAGYDPYLQLLAGWNMLVHVGVANQINLDKPTRARKIGNEFLA